MTVGKKRNPCSTIVPNSNYSPSDSTNQNLKMNFKIKTMCLSLTFRKISTLIFF